MSKKKNPHAVSLGRIGGLKGGKARAAKLTAEQRSEIARKASNTRWANQRKAMLLKEGVEAYKKEGPKFMPRLVAKQKARVKHA
jgi:hypothetical protein